MNRRVAVLGYGAIGREVSSRLARSRRGSFDLAVLLRPGSRSAANLASGLTRLDGKSALLGDRPALVIEAADPTAVVDYAEPCLEAGSSVLVSSVGALGEVSLFARLKAAAERTGAKLILPSGAIGSLDYIRAVRDLDDTRVLYESRKPPSAWRNELSELGFDPDTLPGPENLFTGEARIAAQRFPQNLNVAATLALAGVGLDRTHTDVVVDPAAAGNTHTISCQSSAGTLQTKIVNRPSPANPKTSRIVSMSIVAAVEQFFSAVQFL